MEHIILFSGHMIDAKNRSMPRFPPFLEELVKGKIQQCVLRLKNNSSKNLTGIAGGACGGDILFHEICAQLNIPTEIYLAEPLQEFKKNSVSFAGPIWDTRFDALTEKIPLHVLPKSLIANGETIWEATNKWMLKVGLSNAAQNITLIALWDGKEGDGKGGTKHMIDVMKALGGEVMVIDIGEL